MQEIIQRADQKRIGKRMPIVVIATRRYIRVAHSEARELGYPLCTSPTLYTAVRALVYTTNCNPNTTVVVK
jgi:hypothetical protein